ncbi:MAG TPA: hypothetical protein VGM88_00160 [Kofleriaceae bacterium]|jgi:DNA topoisomerase-1
MHLRHTSDDGAGIARVRRGQRFSYVSPSGRPVRDAATLARIRSLAIPPAWIRVWISPDPSGHIQATGRDARGRKQDRYHEAWRRSRDEAKYHRFVQFCAALPRLRAAVERDLAAPSLSKAKVLATVLSLMERAQLRVGNEEYARTNGSFGATTLRGRHAHVHGDTLELAYRGKSGVARRVRVTDKRLARIVRRCRDLPGQRLFQYIDGDAVHPIASTDVNEYIRAATGGPFTAKDYRTWAATIGAAILLCQLEHPGSERGCKRCIKEVLDAVSTQLGHTPSVCRASYIHPRLLEDFAADRLAPLGRSLVRRVAEPSLDVEALRAAEPIVARYLDTARIRRRA